MKNKNEHNELDQFLQEKFDGHTIKPANELWETIEQHLSPQVVPIAKYSRLKLVLYSSAAVIAGLLVLLVSLNTPEKNQPITLENELVKKQTETSIHSPDKQLNESPQPGFNSKNTNSALFAEIKETANENSELKNLESSIPLTENNGEIPVEIIFSKLNGFTLENFSTSKATHPEKLKNSTETVLNPELTKSTKPARSHFKPRKTITHTKSRHYSAKQYYSHKSHNKELIELEKFFEKIDLKATLSPMLSMRSLTNLQNVSDMEFDKSFYNSIEHNRISFNGGLELAYNINKNWSIYSGLKLYCFSQKVETVKNQYQVLSSDKLLIPSSFGNITMNGDGIGQLPTQREVATFLRINYVDFPFMARYLLNKRYYFDAGIKYSYLLGDQSRGKIMNTDKTVNIDKIPGLQKNNFGLIFAAGIEHTTRSGIRFELGPEINLSLTNINPTANVVSKPVSLGIKTGIYFGRYN